MARGLNLNNVHITLKVLFTSGTPVVVMQPGIQREQDYHPEMNIAKEEDDHFGLMRIWGGIIIG
jgi:hypothetical protein